MDDYNSADLDDDWFYKSFRRYNILEMFYVYNVPEHLIQLDDSTLCIASRSEKCRKTELLKLLLPPKLTLPAEDEMRSKGNHFEMLTGLYIEHSIHQIRALSYEDKVITSQNGRKGVQMYKMDSESGVSEKEKEIWTTQMWETPDILVHDELKRIICSKCDHKELIIWDISCQEIVTKINHLFLKKLPETNEDACSLNNIKCQLLDNNTLAVLNVSSGVIALIDLRIENTFAQFDTGSANELWALSDCKYSVATDYFGALSTKGNLCLYDIRNHYSCIKNKCFSVTVENVNNLKLKVTGRGRFSISGMDSNIYVYNVVENSCDLVFTHDGHYVKYVSYEAKNLINDHIWVSNIRDNFLVSICNNQSLHCWEYNENIG